MNTTLGKRIAALRREKELKQEELAEKIGVSSQAVSKWENDQTCPDITLLPLLAKILGVSIDELLTGKKDEAPVVKLVPENERKNIGDMMLRIVVTSTDGDVARVNLPLAIIEVVLERGLNLSSLSKNEALKTIDLNMIMNMVRQGAIGNIVEIESPDGDTISIFVE
ncbi:MAG: helix-turn-helix transcriptional regulator [Ruminococcaceae bacterium]|nr:helix-turn-helix transcriptional regulator [Oscillospiraceae bacterium]